MYKGCLKCFKVFANHNQLTLSFPLQQHIFFLKSQFIQIILYFPINHNSFILFYLIPYILLIYFFFMSNPTPCCTFLPFLPTHFSIIIRHFFFFFFTRFPFFFFSFLILYLNLIILLSVCFHTKISSPFLLFQSLYLAFSLLPMSFPFLFLLSHFTPQSFYPAHSSLPYDPFFHWVQQTMVHSMHSQNRSIRTHQVDTDC